MTNKVYAEDDISEEALNSVGENLVKALIRLADKLDRRGQNDLADDIDLIISNNHGMASKARWPTQFKKAIKKYEQEEVEIEIPEEEYETLQGVLKSLQDSLN